MNRFVLLGALFLAPSFAWSGEVTVTKEACQWLSRHVPAADVEYEEGKDVHGHAVAPAELDKATPLALPENIHIPLNVDLAQFLGLPLAYIEQKAYIGVVTLGPDGLLYNGDLLASGDALAAYCDKDYLEK